VYILERLDHFCRLSVNRNSVPASSGAPVVDPTAGKIKIPIYQRFVSRAGTSKDSAAGGLPDGSNAIEFQYRLLRILHVRMPSHSPDREPEPVDIQITYSLNHQITIKVRCGNSEPIQVRIHKDAFVALFDFREHEKSA